MTTVLMSLDGHRVCVAPDEEFCPEIRSPGDPARIVAVACPVGDDQPLRRASFTFALRVGDVSFYLEDGPARPWVHTIHFTPDSLRDGATSVDDVLAALTGYPDMHVWAVRLLPSRVDGVLTLWCCGSTWRPESADEIVARLAAQTPADYRAQRAADLAQDNDPVHGWFGLSYGNYLVVQRSILQSMPVDWQRRFVACLHELNDVAPDDVPASYFVRAKDGNRFIRDPYSNYERGRRRVSLKPTSARA